MFQLKQNKFWACIWVGSLLLSGSAFAQSIEIGAGGITTPNDIQVLIRVDGALANPNANYAGPYVVVGRIRADAAVDASYLDITFEPLTMGAAASSANPIVAAGELSFAKSDLERDLSVDQGVAYKLTVIGLAGSLSGEPAPMVKLGVNASLDLLSVSMIQRYSDSLTTHDLSYGGSIEGTMDVADRFHVALGTKGTEMYSGRHTEYFADEADAYANGYDPSKVCTYHSEPTGDYYYDAYGNIQYVYTSVADCSVDHYDQIQSWGKTYLKVAADLTKNVRLFGQWQYKVYRVRSDTGAVNESNQFAGQFLFGASVRY